MSSHSESSLESKLSQALDTIHCKVVDVSDGCGAKFEAVVVSEKFAGVPLLERHRMVNEVIADELKEIHAFSQKTWTKEQWEKKKKA